jgi:hypothetical protein
MIRNRDYSAWVSDYEKIAKPLKENELTIEMRERRIAELERRTRGNVVRG